MDSLIIHPHAFKHGVSESDIKHAWKCFARKQYRGSPNEGEIVLVGCDQKGCFIELEAAERSFGVIIFHAMRPPTRKVLIELKMVRR